MMIGRRGILLGGVAVSLGLGAPPPAVAGGMSPTFSWIAIDRHTRRIMGRQDDGVAFPPASLTKILLLDLVFDAIRTNRWRWDTVLMMTPAASAHPPSRMGLPIGDTITVYDAVSGVAVCSHNDLAALLGQSLYGSEDAMARAMTQRAHDLGMEHTHFGNCTGLPGAGNISTAFDLARGLDSVMDRHAGCLHFLSMPQWVYRGHVYHNTDHLVGRVPGIYFSKTGYTQDSGFCLAAGIRAQGRDVISVVGGLHTAHQRDRWMTQLWTEAHCLGP